LAERTPISVYALFENARRGRLGLSRDAYRLEMGRLFAPFTGEVIRQGGDFVAPIIGKLLYGFLLAMGYVAEFFVNVIQSLFHGGSFPTLRQLAPPLSDLEEAEALRQIEATRPFIVGAVEIVIALVALIIVIILGDRMARERRQTLPEGATLDREASAGESIGVFLAGLLPRRVRRSGPPRDDGTPGGALRAGALIAFSRQQPPVAEDEHPLGVDEGQRRRFLTERIGAEAVRLQIFVIELECEPGAQRVEEAFGGPVHQVALHTVYECYHAGDPPAVETSLPLVGREGRCNRRAKGLT